MKKTLLTVAAALALVSCSQDDLMQGIENRPTGAIGVKAYVPTITRGTALNNEGDLVKAENGFDLFAFLSDNSQFMGTASDGVAFQGTGTDTYAWNYVSDNEMKFWSEANGSAIKFYAVSPMSEKTASTALTTGSLTKNITADEQTLTYTVPTTCSEQVDLMYAVTDEYASDDESAEHVTNGITLQFRHALSQIVFKAMTESELIYADIESVKITNLNVAGTFNLANAETYRTAEDKTTAAFPWIYTGEANNTFVSDVAATTDINTDVDGNTSVATGKYTTEVTGAISLTESTEALLLLPQNLKNNSSALEISCKVRYKRAENDIAEIVGSETEYKTITVPVETSWQPGYKYTYTLIFTAEMGNPIKVKSVGVDEWNNATDEDVKVEGEEDYVELTQAEKNALHVASKFTEKNASGISSSSVNFVESYSATQDNADVNTYFSYEELSNAGILNSVIANADGNYYRLPTAGELQMLVPASQIWFSRDEEDDNLTTVTETVYLDNTADNYADESGETVTGESTFFVSEEKSQYYPNNDDSPSSTVEANVVYALRFKGSSQYAAYRYRMVTGVQDEDKAGYGLNMLSIQVKALDADDQTTDISTIADENYWTEDVIEITIPASNMLDGYSVFYGDSYGSTGMLLSSTKSKDQEQSYVIWFETFNARTDVDSYGLHMQYPVRLVQCDADGNL